MQWNRNHSILLSRVCVIGFAVLLLTADIMGFWICRFAAEKSYFLIDKPYAVGLLMGTLYLCSFFTWLILYFLWRLLSNMQKEKVFIRRNVKLLRHISWSFFGIAAVSLASTFFDLPCLLVAMAAGFLGLVVRVVKNVLETATAMREELDLTI